MAPVPPASAAVRLVGFVRQAGRLRVALVVEGESVLLGEGEAASGYELISADVNDGVRLKAPDGAELFVPAPELESGG
ncbi:MAG TPA: hypothetical protein VFM88_21470 [Vicinamibacteria bacterium]|nr:hypothetical protein [Vicinamibacteria bacterium]